jgi:ubiquinol-cytochrome c reductase cytochrome b subunit
LGIKPPSPLFEFLAQVGTIIYLAFFLAMPWWSKLGSFKQVPDRVTFHAH